MIKCYKTGASAGARSLALSPGTYIIVNMRFFSHTHMLSLDLQHVSYIVCVRSSRHEQTRQQQQPAALCPPRSSSNVNIHPKHGTLSLCRL